MLFESGLFAVAVWIVALPVPGVAANLFDAAPCLPAQDFKRLVCVGPGVLDVACAARADFVSDVVTAGLAEGFDHVEHAIWIACAEVEDFGALVRGFILGSYDVSLCEIHYVYVVTAAGAVRRVIVVSEYREALAAADCDL